ncbi:MAG: hypothetical protein H7256_09355 [Bdellovibrio sp.]|nr:hypothetical protein [Bdellovibrio sp.]
MKSILLCALFISLFSFSAFSEETAEHQDGPCKKVMDACKEAVDAAKTSNRKMSIYKDCFQPLMKDQTVTKVSIDKADVSACKAKREAHQQKKGK